jgi:hypothetical protein
MHAVNTFYHPENPLSSLIDNSLAVSLIVGSKIDSAKNCSHYSVEFVHRLKAGGLAAHSQILIYKITGTPYTSMRIAAEHS